MVLVGCRSFAVVISAVFAFLATKTAPTLRPILQRPRPDGSEAWVKFLPLMVNAETGMRGYLLTQRDEFLQPYATASQDLPTAMAQARALAEAATKPNSRLEKLRHLNQLQLLVNQQMADLAIQQQSIEMPKTFK